MRALLITPLALLLACGGQKHEPAIADDGAIHISYWQSYNTEEKEVFEDLIEVFQTQYAEAHPDHPPIVIDHDTVPWENVDQLLATSAQSGDTPDIVRMDYNKILPVAFGRVAVPLEEIENFGEVFGGRDMETLRELYVGAAYDAGLFWRRDEYHLWALPEQITCVALLWNRSLFRQRRDAIAAEAERTGLDITYDRAPRTWRELEAMGRALTFEDENGQHYGFGMRDSLWFQFPYLNVHRVEVISQDDETGRLDCGLASDPRAIYALGRLQSYTRGEGAFEGGAWSPGSDQTDGGFEKGTYAMVIEGIWHLKRFNNSGLDFGVDLVPALEPDIAEELGIPAEENFSRTNLGGAGLIITRTALERGVADEALEFMAWWTGPEAQREWGRRLGQIPINREAQADIADEMDEKTAMFIRQSQTAEAYPRVPSYGILETDHWNPNFARMLQGNLTAEEALERIQRDFYRVSLDEVNGD